MNWLIYISGWFLGWVFFNGYVQFQGKDVNKNIVCVVKVLMWTMMWVWFCWRFIRV